MNYRSVNSIAPVSNNLNNRELLIEKAKKEAEDAKKRFEKFQTLLAAGIASKGYEISIKMR